MSRKNGVQPEELCDVKLNLLLYFEILYRPANFKSFFEMKGAQVKNIFLGYLLPAMLVFDIAVDAASLDRSYVRIPGHVPDLVMAKSTFVDNVEDGRTISMTFILPLRNQEELEKTIKSLYDPSDPKFGRYLTSEEFLDRFAPTSEDYEKVVSYAGELGLTVSDRHANRTLLNVTGTAKTIETGFNLGLREYTAKGGRKFYAPNENPEVPTEIAGIITGVVGLDNLAVWHSYHRKLEAKDHVTAKGASHPSGPGGGYAPADLTIAYNLAGIPSKGTGQAIALFQLASYQLSDIQTYTDYFGLPSPKLTHIVVDGGSGEGNNPETVLDIELSLALAPDSQIYVYEGPNSNQGVLDTYNRIATDNIARQVSTSWGLGEGLVSTQYLQAENAIFMQMAAHGQTIYAAAGDSGAYDNYPATTLMVDDPASQPYVTGVGGTTLSVNSATGVYGSETVWNGGFGNGAGGGGVSSYWPIPSWQANVPSVYSKTYRNVPDVSLNADPGTGYAIYFGGQWVIYGGTSCAAPLWASFTACVNQDLLANNKPALGFANPAFYAIGSKASSVPEFHDIVTGNNQYYDAKAGFDDATGWGSFNGGNLFATLTNSSTTVPPINPPTNPPPPPVNAPALAIKTTHTTFRRGGTGTYQISVSNQGKSATSGNVQLAIDLPDSVSPYAYYGSGWTLQNGTLTFSQKNSLQPGGYYPTLTLYVRVDWFSPSSVTTTLTASGGGAPTVTLTDTESVR